MSEKKQTDCHAAHQGKPVTDDAILKVAKEVVIKFIEVGRLSPGNFGETFQSIYRSVHDTVRSKN